MNKFDIYVDFVANSVFGCYVVYVNRRTFKTKLLPVRSGYRYKTWW